ncbi:Ferritin-like metal-binding protein YciE [Dyadobacter koreensis]|uniref:Ferritin-like metal-binding protein YciE n=1 Tax=Dyadobacter koreensis TaxID=408657 RepID=A0A1H6YGV8_9BACT|nr:DUF892 family protein [Dyadobacter koreensis]SEJ40491.1 Ferritin-like metal-binding protein YciE [Dyadobacter koreensis]
MYQEDNISLNKSDLEEFFIHHLNKIYAAKTLLVSELPELFDSVYFSDLREGILDTIEEVKKQISRMDEIYDILDISYIDANPNGLKGLIEDSFQDIKQHSENPELRDMSILFYLHNIESIEMASFQILEMLAVKLRINKIKQLIQDNYEDAKASRTLLLLINAKYISTV